MKFIKRWSLSRFSRKPVSDTFGFDRGQPIDRYYIEKFLLQNQSCVTGDIIEVGGKDYANKYAKDVKSVKALHYSAGSDAEIIADLSAKGSIEEQIADCFIIPQTYQFIFDIDIAISNSVHLLKPGGTLLATVPGITPISEEDYKSWGQYWSFTDMSIKKLFEDSGGFTTLEVTTFGNLKSATGFLYGYASHELRHEDLDFEDMRYPVIMGVKVVK